MHLLPRSIFGRLGLLLLSGLVLAQLLSAFILLRDRGQVLYEAVRENMVARVAGVVRLLDSLPTMERQELLPLLSGSDLRITFSREPASSQDWGQVSKRASKLLRDQLLEQLPAATQVLVSVEDAAERVEWPPMHHQHRMAGSRMSGPWAYVHGLETAAWLFRIQVKLKDGSWVRIERALSERWFDWPARLVAILSILLASVIVLSLLGVRLVTRPLRELRRAADGLGKDIQRPPLEETGPSEVRDTARAFNTMQTRLKSYIEDRASILAAISHDLKTPLTRMRLRTDLMDDEALREKTQKDLDDMEAMVSATLDFMRGSETREPSQSLDLMALLESIRDDALDAGKDVELEERKVAPYEAKPIALKRCIVNLVENAVRYAGHATVTVEDGKKDVVISVCDSGPGIPDDALAKVFDPFFRLESSRAQHTGGTGLGLGIARNIARAHGGSLTLHNRPKGGLCAKLILPR